MEGPDAEVKGTFSGRELAATVEGMKTFASGREVPDVGGADIAM